MKRNKRKMKQAAQRKAAAPTPSTAADDENSTAGTADPGRRRFLKFGKTGMVLALAAGAGGFYVVKDVRATMRELDLSQIGNGVPTVVQIHDPQCPVCTSLQREARAAVCEFDEGELQFLVANIKTEEGRALARQHGVGHVTLLLFDGDGKRRTILTGPQQAEFLVNAFKTHFGNPA